MRRIPALSLQGSIHPVHLLLSSTGVDRAAAYLKTSDFRRWSSRTEVALIVVPPSRYHPSRQWMAHNGDGATTLPRSSSVCSHPTRMTCACHHSRHQASVTDIAQVPRKGQKLPLSHLLPLAQWKTVVYSRQLSSPSSSIGPRLSAVHLSSSRASPPTPYLSPSSPHSHNSINDVALHRLPTPPPSRSSVGDARAYLSPRSPEGSVQERSVVSAPKHTFYDAHQ